MEWKPGKNLLLAGICLLPFLAPAQEYFESPREHDYQITLQNGTEAGVTVTESWHESRKIRSFCGKLEWNQYPNGRFPIISTLEGVGGYSTIEKARLLDLGRQMGVTPPENRRTITPEWLRAFQSALASSLGDTPFAVDFADTAQTTFYRGEEDCQRLLSRLPNYTAPPSCDGMEYTLYSYSLRYEFVYPDPEQGHLISCHFTQFHDPAWLTTRDFSYDCSYYERCRAEEPRDQTFMPTDENGTPIPFPPGLKIEVEGTGRTTGHVLDLFMTNTTPDTIVFCKTPYVVPATKTPKGMYYQGFVTEGYASFAIPPGEMALIPVEGLCLNVDLQPPTGAVTTVENWITPFTAPALPPPGAILPPGSGFQLVDDPAQQPAWLTYPGTDIPFPYSFDMKGNLTEAAALLFGIADQIRASYARLDASGRIHSPYSHDPALQALIFTQQPVWIATSLLSGAPYTEEEFQENLERQYRENYGKDIDQAPPAVVEEFEEGVANMWETFNLIGADAKIMASAGDE